MSFEEEFDKIIRQKSEEAEFQFSEKNWESASSMIDADRKAASLLRTNKFKKPLMAVSILLIVVATTLYYFDSSSQAEPLVAENQNNTANDLFYRKTTPSINKELKGQETEISIATNEREKKVSNPTSRTSQKAQAELTSEKTSVSKKSVIIPTASNEVNSSKPEITAKIEKEEPTENISNPILLNSENIASNTEENKTSDLADNQSSDLPLAAIAPEVANAKILSNEKLNSESETAYFKSNESLSADYLSAKVLQLESNTPEKNIEQIELISKFDTEYFKQKRKTHYLNFEVGTSYLTGWNTNNGIDAKGLDYFGGFNYGVYLSNKLNVSVGLQAYSISHINQPFYESSHKDYDFGSTTIYTVVTCGQMYYAALPLKINYQINHKNQFGLGLNLAYLFKTSTNIESYYYQDNSKISTGTSHSNEVFENMNQYNTMVTASYQRRLGKRFGIGAEVIYGLSDLYIKSDQNSLKENTIGLRLALNYTIFDK